VSWCSKVSGYSIASSAMASNHRIQRKSELMRSEVVGSSKEGTMANEIDALREQFLALMATAPMQDYSADFSVYIRVGKLLVQQAEDGANIRRREAR
jgi:hypothetical protein